MLGNFSCFCCRLLAFFLNNVFKILFQEHYQSVRLFGTLDPHQDQNSVGPNLDPNCSQRLSADEKAAASKEKVKE